MQLFGKRTVYGSDKAVITRPISFSCLKLLYGQPTCLSVCPYVATLCWLHSSLTAHDQSLHITLLVLWKSELTDYVPE